MISECITQEEYKERLSVLRKERNNLQYRAALIDDEMNNLSLSSRVIDFVVGKYILIDRSQEGGYKIYFKIYTWKNRPRGICLYGKGFYYNDTYIKLINEHTIIWEEFKTPIEITEEEFFKVFTDVMTNIESCLREDLSYQNISNLDFEDESYF